MEELPFEEEAARGCLDFSHYRVPLPHPCRFSQQSVSHVNIPRVRETQTVSKRHRVEPWSTGGTIDILSRIMYMSVFRVL
jgi:hypothetical protein